MDTIILINAQAPYQFRAANEIARLGSRLGLLRAPIIMDRISRPHHTTIQCNAIPMHSFPGWWWWWLVVV